MITDAGCQASAIEADVFVTALGEVEKGGMLLDCSSINMSELPPHSPKDQEAVIEAEFIKKRERDLSKFENQFVEKVYKLQDLAPPGRYRVYGALRGRKHEIVLVTEFSAFSDEKDVWDRIEATAERLKAKIWIMDEREHLDKWSNDNCKTWQYGPDHGRKEKQVELSWRIEDKSPKEIESLVEKISKETEEIWRDAGVSVS